MSQMSPDPEAGGTPDPAEPTRIPATRARQGRPIFGMMTLLVVSTLLAVVVVFGIWVGLSGRSAGPAGGEGGASAPAARSFDAPQSSPKQTPPPADAAANR